MYKNKVPVPGLAMVDDIATIAVCGSVDSIMMNVQTDSFVKFNKLECQVAQGKCQWVHIGKVECESEHVVNNQKLEEAKAYKYLGDNVSNNLDELYNTRESKAKGYANTCVAMATEISLGFKIYSTAKLLHSAMFLNGTLVNLSLIHI